MKTYHTALWLAERTVIGICLAAMLTTWGILSLGSHAYRLGSRSRAYCLHLQTALQQGFLTMSRTISARIPDALYEQLQATAQALGVSVSELLVRAIYSHLQTPVNSPSAPVNSPELSEYLATIEARLTALEQRVAGIPSLSEQPPHLAGMTVKELRKLAGERGIPKYWLLSKADLIAALG